MINTGKKTLYLCVVSDRLGVWVKDDHCLLGQLNGSFLNDVGDVQFIVLDTQMTAKVGELAHHLTLENP